MLSRNRTAGVLICCLAVISAAQPVAAQDENSRSIDRIVGAIETLEGQSDAKCHATATRLENFMFGTPLTEEARIRKVELQKALILDLWEEASEEAKRRGLSEIPAELIVRLADRALPRTRTITGDVMIPLVEESSILLTSRDVRQYGSIAYALRAILSVQQDLLLDPTRNLLPLSSEAIEPFKEALDIGTLGALSLADSLSREEESLEISASMMERGWKRIFPAHEEIELSLAAEAVAPAHLLRKIIDQKVSSYEQYNQIERYKLLASNIKSYYARYDIPSRVEELQKMNGIFGRVMMNFVAQFLSLSAQEAARDGSPIVREEHVSRVFNEIAPFQVNEYEDITYFFRLPSEDRVVIEAYDADSFRDSGVHWHLIEQTLDAADLDLKVDFDPFASELLAEGTAQMGVLLYRMAGAVAGEHDAPALNADHIVLGAERLIGRMAEHLEAPARTETIPAIASAPSSTRAADGLFLDATRKSGLDYIHRSSDWLKRLERTYRYSIHGAHDGPIEPGAPILDHPPSYSGSGVAADDVDGDGIVDILFVGGLGNRLYLGNGDGTFRDVSDQVDLTLEIDGKPGEARQPLIVDLDNDGRKDIVITYVDAQHRIYRNLGELKFEDVSDRAELGGKGLVGSAATAFDYDRDGLLDLYIGYYGNYLDGQGPNLARVNEGMTPNRLFRNEGDFRFTDVTKGSGVDNTGWTQAVAAVDFDRDGWQDLIVGNDFGVNAYYRNLGNGRFVDVAEKLEAKRPSNAMNVGTADLNGDGYPDVYISNILIMVKDEKYVNPTADTPMKLNPEKLATMRIVDSNHLFTSVADDGGLERYLFNTSIDRGHLATGWAWDADFFDADNDGDDDLYCVNGLNEYKIFQPTMERTLDDGTSRTWMYSVHAKEPNVLFLNESGKLRNRSEGSGADLLVNSRAAAYLDADSDGDLDIVINNYQEPASFLENRSEDLGNNWIKVELVGDPERGSNRDAVGATILATTPSGRTIWRAVQAGTGYLSDHPKVQHLGLGSEESVELKIVWPNGESTEHSALEANSLHVISQSDRS